MIKTIHNVEISSLVGVISNSYYDVAERLTPITGATKAARLCRSIGFHKTRYFNFKYTPLDASYLGAKHLIEQDNIDLNDIDALISCTNAPDYIAPANSYILQNKLGLKDSIICLDMLHGCAGFIYALFQAAIFINTKVCKKVLIVAGDCACIRDFAGEEQIQNAAIFADGVCAAIVSYNENAKPISFNLTNYGELWDVITSDFWSVRKIRTLANNEEFKAIGSHIDGIRLAGFIVDKVGQNIKDLMQECKVDFADLACCVSHQANKNILQSLEHSLKAPKGFIPFVSGDIGNTGSSTIPIALSANIDKYPLIREKLSLMSGFGVGLSIGSTICDLSNTKIYKELYLD